MSLKYEPTSLPQHIYVKSQVPSRQPPQDNYIRRNQICVSRQEERFFLYDCGFAQLLWGNRRAKLQASAC
jgi:hypothetical protein